MTKTLNYGVNRSFDLALLTTLTLGFMTCDMLSVHFGIIVFAFGLNYTFISVPRYQDKIDKHVGKFETEGQFVTDNENWTKVRPIVYLGVTVLISALAYLATT